MLSLPKEAQFLEQFRCAFTAPTYERFVVLCVGAIVTMGRRSVSRILWSVRCLMQGHPSSYHRFFCAARWSLWPIAKVLAAMVVELVPRDQPIVVIADDTVEQHLADHVFAKGCHRHRRRLALVARTRSDMSLYALPPAKRQVGRRGCPPRKGRKLPTPAQTVAAAISPRRHATLRWYGNGVRDLQLPGGCGGWYRHRGSGRAALIPVRWVCVLDPKSGREDFFYTTHPSWTPEQIVEAFAGRWPVEVTFEEVRAHLGFEATRHWCRQSVLRVAPCLLGLFSVVNLIYTQLARQGRVKVHATPCYPKTEPTFADALASVRRLLWEQVILQHAPCGSHVAQLPGPIREMLLEHVTAAA